MSEFDVGVFEYLLDAVGHPSTLANQGNSLPVEITHFANTSIWDEAAAQQSMLEQLRDPLAILHIRLATRHVLYVRRIDKD